MNQAGRDALRMAALNGVRQIIGRLFDEHGGRCALGVLLDAAAGQDMFRCFDLGHGVIGCPLCHDLPAGIREYVLASHLNDQHAADFFKIAELMPVTDAEGDNG